MAKRSKGGRDGSSTIAVNRRARHDYHIDETVEAGLELAGTEVKSLRAGQASLAHSFAAVRDGQAWLLQADIPQYAQGGAFNHHPTRPRRLLLHRHEIDRLGRWAAESGRTLVPLELYWRDGRAKLRVGLGRGKAKVDKRRDIAERDANRAAERAVASRAKGRR